MQLNHLVKFHLQSSLPFGAQPHQFTVLTHSAPGTRYPVQIQFTPWSGMSILVLSTCKLQWRTGKVYTSATAYNWCTLTTTFTTMRGHSRTFESKLLKRKVDKCAHIYFLTWSGHHLHQCTVCNDFVFFNACKIKYFQLPFSHSLVAYLSSPSVENLHPWRCFFKFGSLGAWSGEYGDVTYLQMRIQVQQLVQEVIYQHRCAKAQVPWSNLLTATI